MSVQLPLLDEVEREEKPWKRTHGTSRAVVQKKARDGSLSAWRAKTLRCLLAMWNQRNRSVTALELEVYMLRRGEFTDPRAFQVRARLNELADGWWVRRRPAGGGPRTKHRVGGGAIERRRNRKGEIVRRRSWIDGQWVGHKVMCWRPREIGSQERGPSNT
jgi:hypothetical protein